MVNDFFYREARKIAITAVFERFGHAGLSFLLYVNNICEWGRLCRMPNTMHAGRQNLCDVNSNLMRVGELFRVLMMDVVTPPYRINALLVAMAFAVAALQLAVIPVFLLPEAEIAAAVVVLLLSFSTPFVRALLHEAIHGRMVRKKTWNDRLARALAICSGASFDAMRLGHMTHHRFPRHALDRADIIEPGKSRVVASLQFYCGLLGWVYLREILSSLVMLLPRRAINRVAEFALADDETSAVLHGALRRGLDRRLARIRLDMTAVILIYGLAFHLYGAAWPMLLAAIALRGLIVSLQDNVAHYATPAVVGAAAHNSRTTRWAALFMLNQNLHGVHHDQPELPWHILPRAFSRRGGDYSGGYFSLLMKQFYGPLQANATTQAADGRRAERAVV